eukprot:5118284-Pleurochrysis_carterae.AAC.1
MFIVASLHYHLGGILMYGWTMPWKWGNPVATLLVTNKTIRNTRRMTEVPRINITALCCGCTLVVRLRARHTLTGCNTH